MDDMSAEKLPTVETGLYCFVDSLQFIYVFPGKSAQGESFFGPWKGTLHKYYDFKENRIFQLDDININMYTTKIVDEKLNKSAKQKVKEFLTTRIEETKDLVDFTETL